MMRPEIIMVKLQASLSVQEPKRITAPASGIFPQPKNYTTVYYRIPQTVDRRKSASRKNDNWKVMLLSEGGRSSPDWESKIVNCFGGFATHWPTLAKLGGKCKVLLPGVAGRQIRPDTPQTEADT